MADLLCPEGIVREGQQPRKEDGDARRHTKETPSLEEASGLLS